MTDEQPKYGRGRNPNSRIGQIKKGERRPGAGRKKGTPNNSSLILKVLTKEISASVDGQRRSMTILEASLLRLVQEATKEEPNIKAILETLKLAREAEEKTDRAREARYPFSDVDREVIEEMYRRMKAVESA